MQEIGKEAFKMTEKIKPFATALVTAFIILSSLAIICTSALFEADFAVNEDTVTVFGKSFEINKDLTQAAGTLLSFNERLFGKGVWTVLVHIIERTAELTFSLLDIFIKAVGSLTVQL